MGARVFSVTILFLSLLFINSRFSFADLPPRPPQFIVLAFDGSKALSMWEDTRRFAQDSRSLHFTYFISGVYFLTDANRALYTGPHQRAGASAIGFGGGTPELLGRVTQVNLAAQEGNEIGSHANGHFNGSTWNEADWTTEFQLFNHLLFDFVANNHLDPATTQPNQIKFGAQEIVGFRAPYLAKSDGLWPALEKAHFRYDTSRTAATRYWPEKLPQGFWNFPLAQVTIAGTGKRTLSMDYNFYFTQSQAKEDPAHADLYRQQMLDTYLQYFNSNYNGNRAPLHIGHHFSLFNRGAYWTAMKQFAGRVCSLPEVRCVTYRELADYLDQVPPETLRAYRRGEFQRSEPFNIATQFGEPLDAQIAMQTDATGQTITAEIQGPDRDTILTQGARLRWRINGEEASPSGSNSLNLPQTGITQSSQISVAAEVDGVEVLRSTRTIEPASNRRGKGGASFLISPEELEDRSLVGDLPEAHLEEE